MVLGDCQADLSSALARANADRIRGEAQEEHLLYEMRRYQAGVRE